MGSRSRVTTLADVKEKEDEKLILSSAQYKNLLKTIASYEKQLTDAEESNDKNEIMIITLKNTCLKLKELSKQYKNAIGDKERLEEANRKYLEQMSENALKITDEINNKKMSKHSKKTREELEKIALEELNVFYKELNMEELY